MKPIFARFDLVHRLTDREGVMLHHTELWQVPSEGQIVNIGGNPYRVFEVDWSIPDEPNPFAQYAYVKVQKASDFVVQLGGREY